MDSARRLERLARLGRAVGTETTDVATALEAVHALLVAAGVQYRIVGGLAVGHHGYARFTEDVDVLVDAGSARRLDPLLAAHRFSREARQRLRHEPTGVRVDLLEAGAPMPRPGAPRYPAVGDVGASDSDPRVIGLPALVALKLHARRKQDEADVVALLKPMDEAAYLAIEAALPAELRPLLRDLREDALEELRWEDD
jgi:hypothetical protein